MNFTRTSPFWAVVALILSVAAIAATLFFQMPASSKLDWHNATIEGFAPGVTIDEIVRSRGPAKTVSENHWTWASPDLSLRKEENEFFLSGHQLECTGRTFRCGERYPVQQMMNSLHTGKPPSVDSSVSQGAILQAFGEGSLVDEQQGQPKLVYRDSRLTLTFVINNHDSESSLLNSQRRVVLVGLNWRKAPSPAPPR